MLTFKELKGARRLYAIFEGKLSPRYIKKMIFLSDVQWSRLEESWCAIMHTVVMNRDFNPSLRDMALVLAIQRFKIWYLMSVLRGTRCVEKPRKEGIFPSRYLEGFEVRHDHMCAGLKTISAWLQFASLLYFEKNSRPRTIPWFLGWDHQSNQPTLPWMGGHLTRWRNPIGMVGSVDDHANLCQMRTFGRALPIPSREYIRADLQETVEILSGERGGNPIAEDRLPVIREFAAKIGSKLSVGTMPTRTHISASHSATAFTTQSDGGKAAEMADYLQSLRQNDVYSFLYKESRNVDSPIPEIQRMDEFMLTRGMHQLYDAYGNICMFPGVFTHGKGAFPNPISDPERFEWVRSVRAINMKASTMTDVPWRMMDALYIQPNQLTGRSNLYRKSGKDVLPETVGQMLLLMATADLAARGRYEPKPDWFIVLFRCDQKNNLLEAAKVGGGSAHFGTHYFIPVWTSRQIVRYEPEVYPPVMLTSLPEPGFKARGLGKGDTAYNLIGQTMRFMVEPVLQRDGTARLGLESTNKLWDFLKFVVRKGSLLPKSMIAMSSDYKRATDWLDLVVIESIWSGFLRELPKSHPFWVFAKLIWCPRQCCLDRSLLDDTRIFNSRRGSFQGEPVSFITLTLYNLIILEMTDQFTVTGKDWCVPDPTVKIPRSPRAVCGDDVAALFYTEQFSQKFRQLVTETGMYLSPGKDGDSVRLVIFCEDHVIFNYKDGEGWSFQYVDVIKSRLLTNMSRQGTSRVASVLGKGRMVANQLDWFPSETVKHITVKIFYDLLNRLYDDWPKTIRLPLRLPAHCGGLSLPQVGAYSDWELQYVKYVRWLTKQPRSATSLTELIKLRSLAHRYRYGVSMPDMTSDQLIVDLQKFNYVEQEDDMSYPLYGIYTIDQVKEMYNLVTGVPLSNPYDEGSDPTYSHVVVAARDELGLVPFWDSLDLVERAITFTELLSFKGKKEPEVLTFGQWAKKASRFWHRIEKQYSSFYKDEPIDPNVQQRDVNWWVQNYWNGFVFIESIDGIARRYGPSLMVRLSHMGNKNRASPMLSSQKSGYVDLLQVRTAIMDDGMVSDSPGDMETMSLND